MPVAVSHQQELSLIPRHPSIVAVSGSSYPQQHSLSQHSFSPTASHWRDSWSTSSGWVREIGTNTASGYVEQLSSVLMPRESLTVSSVQQANNTAIGLAIFCFYVLDFALNGLQASLRNLLLDVTPANQLNAGNAWHGRMTNAGNIIGYGFGMCMHSAPPKYPVHRFLVRVPPTRRVAYHPQFGRRSIQEILYHLYFHSSGDRGYDMLLPRRAGASRICATEDKEVGSSNLMPIWGGF